VVGAAAATLPLSSAPRITLMMTVHANDTPATAADQTRKNQQQNSW
jgi:hypothetical protein